MRVTHHRSWQYNETDEFKTHSRTQETHRTSWHYEGCDQPEEFKTHSRTQHINHHEGIKSKLTAELKSELTAKREKHIKEVKEIKSEHIAELNSKLKDALFMNSIHDESGKCQHDAAVKSIPVHQILLYRRGPVLGN
jgi:hypothetical protein